MWAEVAGVVAGAGHDVSAPDLPGPAAEPSLGAWADRLLAEETGRFVAVGSSMGGYLAFELWRRAPERIAGLALVGTRAAADTAEVRESRDKTIAFLREEGVEALWPGLAPRLFAPDTSPEAVERGREIAVAQPVERLVAALRAMRDRDDATPLLGGISVPVLVLRGENDAIVPLEDAKAIARTVPHGELVRLAGTGHLPPLEWPEETSRRLRRFLEDVE